jgi:hypothetical protein
MIFPLLQTSLRKDAGSLLLVAGLSAAFADAALAQTAPFRFDEREYLRQNLPEKRVKPLNFDQSWRQDLERSGVLSRTGPYRFALPLAQIGENGPMLHFTYVPRTGAGSGVYLFFVRINLD